MWTRQPSDQASPRVSTSVHRGPGRENMREERPESRNYRRDMAQHATKIFNVFSKLKRNYGYAIRWPRDGGPSHLPTTCIHKITLGDSDLIKSALAHFADSSRTSPEVREVPQD